MRTLLARYRDPLSEIWLACAQRVGLRVVRTANAYAASDGAGVLAIGDEQTLDADDSLAQMIFHELCHSLIEGPESFHRADWGLENTDDRDSWREHACLRLQWVLAGRVGLRELFAPTTDYRESFWNQLPADPLVNRHDRSVQAAIKGLSRVSDRPWAPALSETLAATAAIAAACRGLLAGGATPQGLPLPSLWRHVPPAPPAHPSSLPPSLDAASTSTCGDCAWHFRGGPGTIVDRCRQTGDRISAGWPRCERWEPANEIDCQTCGACCREAYHAVEVGPRERFVKRHPQLVVHHETYVSIARSGSRCAALAGSDAGDPPQPLHYHCTVYDDRPRTCRDFALRSQHCLTARQRVGLSLG